MNVRIFEKRKGAWHLDFKDADGKRVRPYAGATERDAREAVFKIYSSYHQETIKTPPRVTSKEFTGGITLRDAFRTALKTRESWLQAKDQVGLEHTYKGLGLDDSTPIKSLTRAFVLDLRGKWMREEGKRKGTKLSASTINHRLSMLSVLIEAANEQPHGVKHLSTQGTNRTRRLTDDEFEKMYEWCDRTFNKDFKMLIKVGRLTGARQGELLKLQWADVRTDTLTFKDTKNGKDRILPIRGSLKDCFESLKDNSLKDNSLKDNVNKPFQTLNSDRCTHLWATMRDWMGLSADREFVFHSIRHEVITRMVEGGANTLSIQATVGHASVQTTQKYMGRSLVAIEQALMSIE